MEREIERMQILLPIRLLSGEEQEITESRQGYNLAVNFFGLQFGSPNANVTARQDLTYYQLDPMTGMLQYVQEQATRQQGTKGYTQTLYEAIRIGISLDPLDPFWGRHVQLRKFGIRFLNIRMGDLMPYKYSFVWKVLPASGTPEPTEADMKDAVHRLNAAADSIHNAVVELKKSSKKALAENDKRLKDRGRQNVDLKRLGRPEKGIPVVPGMDEARARLVAARALSARTSEMSDKRAGGEIRAAVEKLHLAQENSERVFRETLDTIVYFNARADFMPVSVRWSAINRFQSDYINAYQRNERALDEANDADLSELTYSPHEVVSLLGMPPEVIVTLQKWETPAGVDATDYLEETWFTATPVIKGIPRYGRLQQIIRVHPDGLQEVIKEGEPVYFNSLGSLRYFRATYLDEDPAPLFFQPQKAPVAAATKPTAVDAFYSSDLPKRIEQTGRELDAVITKKPALPSEANLPADVQRYLVRVRFHIADSRAAELRELIDQAEQLRNAAETETNATLVVQVKNLSRLNEDREKETRARYKEAAHRLDEAIKKAIPVFPQEGRGEWVKKGVISVYFRWIHSGDTIHAFEIIQTAHGWRPWALLSSQATQVAYHLVSEGGWHAVHKPLDKEIHFIRGVPKEDSVIDQDFPGQIVPIEPDPQAELKWLLEGAEEKLKAGAKQNYNEWTHTEFAETLSTYMGRSFAAGVIPLVVTLIAFVADWFVGHSNGWIMAEAAGMAATGLLWGSALSWRWLMLFAIKDLTHLSHPFFELEAKTEGDKTIWTWWNRHQVRVTFDPSFYDHRASQNLWEMVHLLSGIQRWALLRVIFEEARHRRGQNEFKAKLGAIWDAVRWSRLGWRTPAPLELFETMAGWSPQNGMTTLSTINRLIEAAA